MFKEMIAGVLGIIEMFKQMIAGVLSIIVLIVLLLSSFISTFTYPDYHCDVNEVKSVSIVRLDDYVQSEYRYNYTVLAEITDVDTFLDRLNHVKNRGRMGMTSLFEGDVVIRIEYQNGDYDLLQQYAQRFNRNGDNQVGWYEFDEEFEQLLTDYQ